MAFAALSQLRRRKRQLDTLRVMLAGVSETIELAQKIADERELSPDEHNEVDALELRRERIVKGIDETQQLLDAQGA